MGGFIAQLAKSVLAQTNSRFDPHKSDRLIKLRAVPLAFFSRLLGASPEQRQRYEFSGGGTGIHWDELDEDISVEGLLMGVGDRTRTNRMAA
ncbi:MAG: DUF2442 domain-containing protein [Sulfuricella sp.]